MKTTQKFIAFLLIIVISFSCERDDTIVTSNTDEKIEKTTSSISSEFNDDLSKKSFNFKENFESRGTHVIQAIDREIFRLVNQHRKSKGLSPFILSQYASELCANHNDYMISRGRISHDGFYNRFYSLNGRVGARTAGENVAYGYSSANAVVQGWLNSPGHRRNIEGSFTHIGIHAKKNDNGVYYYTQLFYK